MTKEEFIDKAKLIQDKEYDYSKVEYKNNKTKVCVICPIHGEFWIRPNDFLNGHMCKSCGVERRSKSRTFSKAEFIEKAKILFPQYDYYRTHHAFSYNTCMNCFWIIFFLLNSFYHFILKKK